MQGVMPVMKDDYELLRAYAERRDDAAFTELVERHADMVYAAAVRQVGRRGLADDVVQAVFILLEQKASRIDRNIIMAAWLHKATRFAALNAMKNERRRHNHERLAREQAITESTRQRSRAVGRAEAEWAAGALLLDEGVNQLGGADRAAIVLRFLERRPFAEVGKHLGVSEEAAQMRVGRAVEKLRAFFRRKGVALSTASLCAAMDLNTIVPTPAIVKSLLLSAAMRGAKASSSHSAAAALADQTGQTMSFAAMRAAGVYLTMAFVVAAVIALVVFQLLSYRPLNPSGTSLGSERASVEPATYFPFENRSN